MIKKDLYMLLAIPLFLFSVKDSAFQIDRIHADKLKKPHQILKSDYDAFDVPISHNISRPFTVSITELTGKHIFTESFKSADKDTFLRFFLKNVDNRLVKFTIMQKNDILEKGFILKN